mgnify:CR=1 FL=1
MRHCLLSGFPALRVCVPAVVPNAPSKSTPCRGCSGLWGSSGHSALAAALQGYVPSVRELHCKVMSSQCGYVSVARLPHTSDCTLSPHIASCKQSAARLMCSCWLFVPTVPFVGRCLLAVSRVYLGQQSSQASGPQGSGHACAHWSGKSPTSGGRRCTLQLLLSTCVASAWHICGWEVGVVSV